MQKLKVLFSNIIKIWLIDLLKTSFLSVLNYTWQRFGGQRIKQSLVQQFWSIQQFGLYNIFQQELQGGL